MRVEVVVQGIVQGVGFRSFVYRAAVANRLPGYVRNRGDGGVEIVVEGDESKVRQFLADLEEKKPSLSQIYSITRNFTRTKNEFDQFSIIESIEGGDFSGSIIPYDVSICDQCVNELRDSNNRRHDYFFTTCLACGPRYTIIKSLPYDRPNTTMRSFSMCKECTEEYADPSNRRFHAQTIACQKCGPEVYLTENTGNRLLVDDPIREAGKLIEEGHILAVKGNGGFHLVTSTTKSEPLKRLRTIKQRSKKPFATMARSLAAAKSFAEVDDAEAGLLTSAIRPIVLVKKNSNYSLSDLVSPALHTVGVMLPYSGLHYMLFDQVKDPAFVMTSANAPNEPIVTSNNEAQQKLGEIVDFFLFHNRVIAQRCDDSVVRFHNGETSILRRSRGYAPSPIHLRNLKEKSALGLGAEENVNA
ncbi:carbamoyltransferase HypF, partial [Candidatus Bathyarchaeota archaeon]|nr:carbamoyltransferase HypF [Candidatus Bathyarchaeota archaeon]